MQLFQSSLRPKKRIARVQRLLPHGLTVEQIISPGTDATLPNGCIFYIEPKRTNDKFMYWNRIGFITNAADPNDALSSGYSTASMSLRLCMDATGKTNYALQIHT